MSLIPTTPTADRFGPLAAGDRGEPVRRGHEPVPRLAAGRDDGVVARPDPQAELVLARVLPDVLGRVLRAKRETSRAATAPTSPRHTSAPMRSKPARRVPSAV